MKVALCFWGLTRSLKFTHKSIQDKILNVLKNASINYTIFLHTYKFKSKYYNPRAKEVGLTLDFDDYKLLNANFVQIDDQDEIKKQLNLQQYRYQHDPWNTNYICVDNFICAMYSKKQLGKMVENSGQEFDRIIFLRPDVKFLNNFDVSWLSLVNNNNVIIPGFALFSEFNDRFCIANCKNAQIYCNLFDNMLEYSKAHPLHSETFQSFYLRKVYRLSIQYILFFFNRVRSNGHEEYDSYAPESRPSGPIMSLVIPNTNIQENKPSNNYDKKQNNLIKILPKQNRPKKVLSKQNRPSKMLLNIL